MENNIFVKKSQEVSNYEYNSNNKLSKKTHDYKNNTNILTTLYLYDKDNYKIEMNEFDGTQVYDVTCYKYDSNKNMIEISGKDSLSKYVYDSKNNRIETHPYKKDSKKSPHWIKENYFWTSEYDDDGNNIKTVRYTQDSWTLKFFPDRKLIYKYDEDNNMIESSTYIINDSEKFQLDNQESYRYDENNNRIEKISFNYDWITEYKYDTDNNIVEEIVYYCEKNIFGKIKKSIDEKIEYQYEFYD